MPKAQKIVKSAAQKSNSKKALTGKKAPVISKSAPKGQKTPLPAAVSKKSPKELVSKLKKASIKIKKGEKLPKKVAVASKVSIPKKPQSAYQIFSSQMHIQMKDMSKFKSLTMSEKSKVIHESWNKISESQKQAYNDQAADQKKSQNRKMKRLGLPVPVKEIKKSAKNDKKRVSSKSSEKSKGKDKKAADEIVKPKKALTPYMYFNIENYKKVKKENPSIKHTDIYKKNGEAWQKLTEEQKKPFDALHQKDVKRHEKEMKEFNLHGYYTNSDGVKSTFMTKKHRVQEFEVGTVLPKGVKSPFCIFMSENLTGHYDGKHTERMKKASEQWKNMSADQKKKYEQLSKKDEDRYNKQMADLRKNGYFTNAEGVKSSDMVKKAKRSKSPKKQ